MSGSEQTDRGFMNGNVGLDFSTRQDIKGEGVSPYLLGKSGGKTHPLMRLSLIFCNILVRITCIFNLKPQ